VKGSSHALAVQTTSMQRARAVHGTAALCRCTAALCNNGHSPAPDSCRDPAARLHPLQTQV